MNFYTRLLSSALKGGHLHRSDRILIIGGGEHDRRTMVELDIENVLITNLAHHAGQSEYAPYAWQREDAEALSFRDQHFDRVIEHAALHHLGSPHRGLLEMLRVAQNGIIAFEARDSALMRLAVRLGLTSDYELEPAFLSGGIGMGFRDTPIPNYVTRWTEAEVRKVVCGAYPAHEHGFTFFYGLSVPVQRFRMARSPALRLAGLGLHVLEPLLRLLLGKQGNSFGFMVLKNTRLQPWLRLDKDGAPAPGVSFLASRYDKSEYVRQR